MPPLTMGKRQPHLAGEALVDASLLDAFGMSQKCPNSGNKS
jgi:hypothetical protein